MQDLQPIEGITPGMLWTALIVLIGIATLYVLYGKVAETYRKQQDVKRLKNDPGNKLAEGISQKVLDRLEPRFAEIDRKLANDKANIDSHTREISSIAQSIDRLKEGDKAQCYGMLALLNHTLHNGNKDEIEEASKKFNTYLAGK